MSVDTNWSDPSTSGVLDLSTGGIVTEAIWDAILSNLKRMGGTDGDTKTGDMKFGANKVYVNDSANAKMTVGLTLNQAGNDDEIIDWKSSDVAHGMTDLAETDTYMFAKKRVAAAGGVNLWGLNGGGSAGMILTGVGSTQDTTKSTAAVAAVEIEGSYKNGTTHQALGANGNLFAVLDAASGNCRFIVDEEGDVHADAGSGSANTGQGYFAYDEFDDIQLVRALELERNAGGLVRSEFDAWVKYNRRDLEHAGIASFNDRPGQDGHVFINYFGLARLHSGAIWQIGLQLRSARDDRELLWQAITELAERNLALEARIALLGVN